MKRLVIVAMLIVGTISFSGCANGPIRNLFRGDRCGADYGTPAQSCGSAIGGSVGSSFYGGYENATCSECGGSLASPELYDSNIYMPSTTGPLPAPGPQN